MVTPKWTRDTWPIAAAMLPFPGTLPDGRSVQDQSAEEWAATLAEVADTGFTEIDPTDSWLRIGDLSPQRLDEFQSVVKSLGLSIPAISTSRRSVIDPVHGDEYYPYCHRLIDAAVRVGADAVCFGFMEALNEAQKQALWFWTAQGPKNPDDQATWNMAVERIRDLGRHAADVGLEVSLEMYEDTYLGTPESAIRFTEEVDLPNVGINADLGNLIRLHRPMERWDSMLRKLLPYLKYWHVKNYTRTEDPETGAIITHPAPLESGIINYRAAVRMAIEHGFESAFLCEHYGGDGLSVAAANRSYLRRILPRPMA